MSNLQELFEQCVESLGKTDGTMKFLLEAKKANPEVKMGECMQIAGFKSEKTGEEGEKENVNLAQKFRSHILKPVRTHITKAKFKLSSDEAEALWARSEDDKSEEQIAQQAAVLALLPARSRTTTPRSKDLAFLNDSISL